MFDKNLTKRILAYIIDSTIILLLTLLITNTKYLNPTYDEALEKSNTLQTLNMNNMLMQSYFPLYYKEQKLDEDKYNELIKDNEYFGYLLVDAYSDKEITEDEYNSIIAESKKIYDAKAPEIYKEALQANWYTYLVYIIVYFGYLVIFNVITKGITLGKKITNLQIVSVDNKTANFGQYLLRSLIAYGYFVYLVEIIIPYIVPTSLIVKMTGGLSLVMNILQIVVAISIVSNEEHRGFHDKLAKTKVIDTKDSVLEAKITDLKMVSEAKAKELEEIIKVTKEKNQDVNEFQKDEDQKDAKDILPNENSSR